MPNNKYLRGRRREQELVKKLRAEGWVAARSAGSKSKFDVFAIKEPVDGCGEAEVRLFQLKSKKGARGEFRKYIWRARGNVDFIWITYK